ncbi:BTAD domain-containing putative transcriptional regulator [Kitasatospora cinereorecta]|uniref:BTAD domain-containing putative transcriptional regulator n=1 Tax=Kitasatospora cinereorecta TaxID=285560 RepID=A0ABW0VMD8_9ACTN
MAARGAHEQTRHPRPADGGGGYRHHLGGPGGPRRPVAAPPPRRRRSGGSLAAALAARLALLGLLAAVPALLLYGTLAVAGMGAPAEGGVVAALTGPDDGRLFLWALVAVGWLAWLCFAGSVLLEIPAQLRGRVARRLPALGWSQRLAAGLVGSVLALLPVAGSAFAATPERPQIAAAPAQVTARAELLALPAAAPATAPAAAEQQPAYTVRDTRPADSLWSIAERQLGSGERWVEIAKLNDGRVMDDAGLRFDADRPIQPGWRLLMPADAKADDARSGTPAALPAAAPTPAHSSVTVHDGDTLSAIAQRELGDAERWPQIFAANQGAQAPDGERLTDPDLVVPGMVLSLPGAPAAQPPAPAPTDPGQQPEQPAPATPAPSTPVPAASAPAPATPAPSGAATEQPSPSATAPSATPVGPVASATPQHTAPAAEPSDDYRIALAASTISVLLAAVMIGAVARRRTDQQRARRPRHRITMPAPSAARFEAELRARQDTEGLELLNRALRTLARNTVRGGKKLPALVAARVTPARTVELHLAAPAVPIAPFRAAHAPNVWWCPDDASDLLSAGQAAKHAAPYPALVTLGSSPDGSVVLADLETVRLVHLSGHPEDAEDVLRTLAVELAHSPLADRLHLHLVGVAADLPGFGPAAERIHHHASLEDALTALGPRTAKARATLVAADATSPRDARSLGRADDSWTPEIVLSAQPPTGTVPAELGRLLDGRPRTCLAVITRAPERGAGPVARWTLPSTGAATLPGLHLTVELQRMDREQYEHIGELVRSSADFAQHPAPDWTLEGPGEDLDPAELPLPVPVLATVGAAAEADEATTRLLARVIGTGASPFAGTAPTATPPPASAASRHIANALGLHAVNPGPAALPAALPPGVPAAVVPVRPAAAADGSGGADSLSAWARLASGFPLGEGAADAAPVAWAADPEPADAGPDGLRDESVRLDRATAQDSVESPLRPALPLGGTGPAATELPDLERESGYSVNGRSDTDTLPLTVQRPAAGPVEEPVAESVDDRAEDDTTPLPAVEAAPEPAPTPEPAPAVEPAPAFEPAPEPAPTHDQAPAPDPHATAAQTRPAPRPETAPARTDSDDLLAILRSPEAHTMRGAPRIRLLGPADVLGAAGSAEPSATARLTELAAYLALRPGTEHTVLDRDIHPGAAHLDPRATVERLAEPLPAKLVALSGWLGAATDGRPFLSAERAEAYTLAPTVTCDWDEFRSLYRRGMRSTSATADAALAHALALVRGAPFAETPAGAYGWAETERQDMLAAIVDTAHELAARRLQYGDHRTAEAAIFRALAVAPDVELLHRDLFYAYASAGAREQLVRAVNRLDALSRRTGRDLDPDTVALLRDLLTGE